MAYTQKGNPFKQKPTAQETLAIRREEIKRRNALENKETLDLAKRLNKMRFEMGHLYPIVSKEEIENREYRPRDNRYTQRLLDETAQTEEERLELYNQNKKLRHDIHFIQTAKKAGGETFDKLLSLPNEDLINFQNEVIRVAKPLVGLEISGNKETLDAINGIDLSGFKPFLEKANINTGDIRKIVDAQISNMPDENEDGTPDVFEGIKGKVIKKGVDLLINQKINQLK